MNKLIVALNKHCTFALAKTFEIKEKCGRSSCIFNKTTIVHITCAGYLTQVITTCKNPSFV